MDVGGAGKNTTRGQRLICSPPEMASKTKSHAGIDKSNSMVLGKRKLPKLERSALMK